MKYYLLNTLDRIKQYSQKLDAEAVLYNKSWVIFNDTGDKDVFMFRANNELLISKNGIVSKGKWELLPTGSILIDMLDKSYMFNASFVSNELIALNLDGNSESLIMLEENLKNWLTINTLTQIEQYLNNTYIPKNNYIYTCGNTNQTVNRPTVVTSNVNDESSHRQVTDFEKFLVKFLIILGAIGLISVFGLALSNIL